MREEEKAVCTRCGHEAHLGDICLEPVECDCGIGDNVCGCHTALRLSCLAVPE